MEKKRFRSVKVILLVLAMLTGSFILEVSVGSLVFAEAGVKINSKRVTLKIGESKQLKISGTKRKAMWFSSNETVATVSSKGLVKAVDDGKATITGILNNKKYMCQVTVKRKNVDYIELDETSLSLEVGDTEYIIAMIYPDGSVDEPEWESSDETVVSVDEGTIFAEEPGTAVITAKAGGKKAECVVTVKESGNINNDYPDNNNVMHSAYDILYDAVINSGYVNKEGNPLITYEYSTSVNKDTTAIIYDKQSNQFELTYFHSEKDGSGHTLVSTYIGRNGSKTISIDCVSTFNYKDFFDITGYVTVAEYTEHAKSVFKIKDSSVSTSFCEKQGEAFIHLLLITCDLCLLENNVGVTMADLGFINY